MKRLSAILVALAMVLSMTSALAEPYNPDDYPVAICMSGTNHPVHRIVQLGFLQAAESFGYERGKNVNVIGTEGWDNSEVYAAAEAFAAEGGKGILLWAGDASAFETIANLSAQDVVVGVPHFKLLKDDGTPPEGLTFNLACDPVLYGKQVAELMAEKLSGKEGSVALTQNTKNVTENSASESFVETWNNLAGTYDLSKITVLPVELEGGSADTATAVNLSIIQAHPDLLGAFGTTGNSPITWADAATKAGKADGELVLVGMDATVGNLEYLSQGKVAAIAAQPLYQEAYKTMEYFNEIFMGNEVPFWTDLVAPIVTLDGEGENGIQYHLDIASGVAEFFK